VEPATRLDFSYYGLRRCDSARTTVRWLLFQFSVSFTYSLITPIDIWLFCDQKHAYHDLQHHVVPLPYLERIPSVEIFYLLYIVEMVVLVTMISTGITQPAFVIHVASEMTNIVSDYCEQMRNVSAKIERTANAVEIFERDFIPLVKKYQIFIEYGKFYRSSYCTIVPDHFFFFLVFTYRKVKLLQPYQNLFSTLMLIAVFNSLFSCVYIILLVEN
jgi:hypothetical protein